MNLAIDVAILFTEESNFKLLELSDALSGERLKLGTEDYFPHLSLFKGVISDKHLNEVKAMIESVALDIEILEVREVLNEGHEFKTVALKFDELFLEDLHYRFKEALEPYMISYIKREDFIEPETIDTQTLEWVEAYKEDPSYRPHLSLGFGVFKYKVEDYRFLTPERIALVQMGEYCSARKLL